MERMNDSERMESIVDVSFDVTDVRTNFRDRTIRSFRLDVSLLGSRA